MTTFRQNRWATSDTFQSCPTINHCPQGWGFPCDHYPWCIGPHHTGTPSHLGYVQTCSTWTSLYGDHPYPQAPVQGTTPIIPATAPSPSYWNAFLSTLYLQSCDTHKWVSDIRVFPGTLIGTDHDEYSELWYFIGYVMAVNHITSISVAGKFNTSKCLKYRLPYPEANTCALPGKQTNQLI